MDFPVIDISHIDDPEAQLSIAQEITRASQTWGFLLLRNHPITPESIENMFSLSHDFFTTTPEADKAPWPINSHSVGYSATLSDANKDDKASIWLSGAPGYLASDEGLSALPPYWRDKTAQIELFKHACHGLVTKLLVCFALALGLEDRNYFAKAHAEDAEGGTAFRMLWYPRRDGSPSETTTRMSEHSDSGSVTLLFQTCAGLEVEAPDGKGWVAAPHLRDHILVNLGDALALWSGRQLKATKHRVTFAGVPPGVERMSIAYFGKASPDTILEPLQVAGAEKIEQYTANGLTVSAGITVREYSRMIMESIYGSSVTHEPSIDHKPLAGSISA